MWAIFFPKGEFVGDGNGDRLLGPNHEFIG